MSRPRGYGQFCPVAKAAETLSERWTILVVRELVLGSRRFVELQRGIPLISPTMLSQRLRELVDAGVVDRRPTEGRRGAASWDYELTQAGEELAPVIEQMAVWGQRWAVTELTRENVEPAYLMWACHKNLRPGVLGAGRTLIEFELVDGSAALRRWWLLIDGGEVDLCLTHPGGEVDLSLATEGHVLARICLGHITPEEVVECGAIRFAGSAALAESFPAWCPRSPIADVPRPERPEAHRLDRRETRRPASPPRRPS